MSTIHPAAFAAARTPDDLLQLLFEVGREPVSALRAPLFDLLEHDDSDVREEALRILVTRWKDRDARPCAVAALRSDPAPNVRSTAAFAIASSSSDASRPSDTRLLIEVLDDEGEEPDVRGAAYEALIILHRKDAEPRGWPFPTKLRSFDLGHDVDWTWIAGLRVGR